MLAFVFALMFASFTFVSATFVSLATSVFAFFTGFHLAAILGVLVHTVFAVVLGTKGVFAGAFMIAFMIAFMVALIAADFSLSGRIGVFFGGWIVASGHTKSESGSDKSCK